MEGLRLRLIQESSPQSIFAFHCYSIGVIISSWTLSSSRIRTEIMSLHEDYTGLEQVPLEALSADVSSALGDPATSPGTDSGESEVMP